MTTQRVIQRHARTSLPWLLLLERAPCRPVASCQRAAIANPCEPIRGLLGDPFFLHHPFLLFCFSVFLFFCSYAFMLHGLVAARQRPQRESPSPPDITSTRAHPAA
ncbi:hypothetical protein CALCODRAFT_493511 [Calocera cornea HHB12733]|uniref:Uncharacterized protein n=1 Tax=Calocera cornea HHB12733 TaxID=1353952 RepID=A0A165HPM4_9BASI|nr:hypothetical protein CALCODRAFT_493511 [Calocera cornea HHB12733]